MQRTCPYLIRFLPLEELVWYSKFRITALFSLHVPLSLQSLERHDWLQRGTQSTLREVFKMLGSFYFVCLSPPRERLNREPCPWYVQYSGSPAQSYPSCIWMIRLFLFSILNFSFSFYNAVSFPMEFKRSGECST